ncbi:MAG: hydrogenase maturation protease [Bacteroidales bacterium]|nr:hydrogenase maturation protease [Bacteroidales bacterium]MCF8336364.1 hydrogenase maturation protease [Bacteroidales bacterium]
MSNWFNIDRIDWNALLFVGMGNRIKRDDGVGIYISEQLKEQGIEDIVIAENSIENYIGKINDRQAKTIVMIDAMDMTEEPGFYKLVTVSDVQNTTTNTHNLSLSTISSFFDAKNQWVLGIQPEEVTFGMGLTPQVQSAADRIVRALINSYNKNQKIPKP